MDSGLLFKNYRAMRRFFLASIEDLTEKQMLAIPQGAANNILWNLGHVIADECNMLYEPSGLSSPLPETFHALFNPDLPPRTLPEFMLGPRLSV